LFHAAGKTFDVVAAFFPEPERPQHFLRAHLCGGRGKIPERGDELEMLERAQFAVEHGVVRHISERLFRAEISFPANVPTGDYRVEVFLAKDRDVVSGQTTPLRVEKVGIDAEVSDFARREAAAYGAIAVLTAVVAGWLASLPFRGV